MTKLCKRCGVEKGKEEFSPFAKSRDGLFSWCKQCNRELQKGRYAALSPEERKWSNRHHRSSAAQKRAHDKQSEKYRIDQEYRAKILRFQKEKYANNAAYASRARAIVNSRRYGLTPEEYIEKVSKPCEICGDLLPVKTLISGRIITKMTIDHCHSTNKVRGTLCAHCNSGLGDFRDSAERLRSAADYLERYAALSLS